MRTFPTSRGARAGAWVGRFAVGAALFLSAAAAGGEDIPDLDTLSPSDTLRDRLEQEMAESELATPVTLQERLEELGVPREEARRVEFTEATLDGEAPLVGEEIPPAVPTEVAVVEEPPHFGHELFAHAPETFVPLTAVPVGPDYVVGPGDELVIDVWGHTELSYTLTVSREGSIILPEVGLLRVAGRTMGSLEKLIERELGRFYSGIEVSVTVGRLRTVTVFVVGEVLRPGAYTLSSLSTVFLAFYASGGPTPMGSLRRVRLVRQGGEESTIDFYPYLLQGDNTGDERLREGDTIFVPPVIMTATVLGAVRRPAIYELAGGETLGDLMEMAGGTTADAYGGRISVERFWEGREKRLLDIDPATRGEEIGLASPLRDGDVVTFFTVLDERVNRVSVEGHVRRPGEYEMREGMRVMDLVEAAGGVRGEAYLARAEIVRTNLDRTTEVVSFDLGRALAGDPEENPLLQPLDRVRVFSLLEALPLEEVVISGEVKVPGSYPLTPGMTLAALVFAAGGLERDAHLERAEVARFRPRKDAPGGGDIDILEVSLTGYATGQGMSSLELQQGDRVFVRRVPRWRLPENVELVGEVRFPGVYPLLQEGETLSHVISRAGGVSENCHLPGVVFERPDEGRVVVDVDRLLRREDEREDLILHDGDRIYFPRIPETVRVLGAVYLPGSIKFVRGRKPSYYIERCGGLLETADPAEVRVIRANGTVERVRSFWFDPTVEPGNLVEVPVKPSDTTDWIQVFHDSAETLASVMATVFFAYAMATRD